jgi:hypothetical protein
VRNYSNITTSVRSRSKVPARIVLSAEYLFPGSRKFFRSSRQIQDVLARAEEVAN